MAPVCVDGAINGRVFLAWIEQHVVRELKPGNVVVLDDSNVHNVHNVHKVAGVREAAEAAGATVRDRPPCSPDLNPIEPAFAKFKKLSRDGAERTTEALRSPCGRALDPFPEQERRPCFRHRGRRDTSRRLALGTKWPSGRGRRRPWRCRRSRRG